MVFVANPVPALVREQALALEQGLRLVALLKIAVVGTTPAAAPHGCSRVLRWAVSRRVEVDRAAPLVEAAPLQTAALVSWKPRLLQTREVDVGEARRISE